MLTMVTKGNDLPTVYRGAPAEDDLLPSLARLSGVPISIREAQTIGLWLCGLSAKESSQVLGLSPRTVETYRENIKNKFSITNKIKFFDLLIRNKLHIPLVLMGGSYITEYQSNHQDQPLQATG
ncbi:probable two component response regulator protein containing GerE domain [Hahella chejuensis KCTC 2396]|uniref:Probable two component response regulator protein containing GerE domain n=2 Tax=Hahellaceae TaxID=224379 RepID=Q2S7W2_HAHCH|nr:probable two component response regulator protein containing GerE domain [Hahella chejuensis KCTC 2396]